MILISWMLFKNFFQSLYDYDIYKLLESVFVQTIDREKNISFVLGTDLLCISPFNSNLLVLQSLWRFTRYS